MESIDVERMDDMEEEEEQKEVSAVAAFVQDAVEDWDDEAKSRARFKALSGQRSDWEPQYRFWRDLILKVARHLHTFIIRPSRLKRRWFRRAGISPLCLDRVLLEMHRAGYLLLSPTAKSTTTTATSLSRFLRSALDFLAPGNQDDDAALSGDCYIIAPLLEEQALQVVSVLSENHWTKSCVVTVRKFEDICLGATEARAILGYLSSRGKATEFTIDGVGADPIEGVKVSLVLGAVSSVSSMDRTVLHLIWTTENLERRLHLIDQQYMKSRNSALASLKSGNRENALRYVKKLKLVSQSRERCTALLDRVEKVLNVITDAESSRKVLEAIQSSTQAIRKNQISVEEVELCLQEVDENVDSLKRLDNALESTASYGEIDGEDIEDQFNQLKLEIEPPDTSHQVSTESGFEKSADVDKPDALAHALARLTFKDGAAADSVKPKAPNSNSSMSKEERLEAA
ncbi:uncharacterized protein LOC127243107 isoform X1 [Andrographis paniculata]|uniref:uncharacterized protein LOC127243107 isoform X1 n=1 Tax=Andrographis paniculata TaxID=175694 RepID=UPI0021E7DAC3|nr:uncharacterized protein LOC127243107 isoform X1 [Andrographis paniculata]XP_051118932.1 uncharacterized protein LOC127243107 isoform X1 [Andrographis paniculata]